MRERRERQDFSDFPAQLRELIANTEKEKPEFLELFFNRINEKMLEIIKGLGIECQPASLNQIHVIPRSTMQVISEHRKQPSFISRSAIAEYDPVHQSIFASAPRFGEQESNRLNAYAKLYFLRMIGHELVHLYSYRSYTAFDNLEKRERSISSSRSGIMMGATMGRSVFHYLNEGLTDQIAEDVFHSVMQEADVGQVSCKLDNIVYTLG